MSSATSYLGCRNKKKNHSTNFLNNNKLTNTMKKISSLIIALFVLSAGTVFAQTSDVANINVTANVNTPLAVEDVQAIGFGDVFTGTQPSIDASSTDAGSFRVVGQADEEIQVTFTEILTMTQASGDDELDFNGVLVSDASGNQPADDSGALASGSNVSLSGSGEHTFWLGGTITSVGGGDIPNAFNGEFSGTFEVTVAYTSL